MLPVILLIFQLLSSHVDSFPHILEQVSTFALPHQYPWMLDLQNKEGRWYHHCGASLISRGNSESESDIAVTAAHCITACDDAERRKNNVTGRDLDAYQIIAGNHNLRRQEEGETVHSLSLVRCYPRYQRKPLINDIALVKLASPIKFSKHVKPIALSKQGVVSPPGTKCIVAGWGNVRGGKTLDVLRHANVTIETDATCLKLWKEQHPEIQNYRADSKLCGGQARNEDSRENMVTCPGDSGGPLMCHFENGTPTLVGIMSGGQGGIACRETGISPPDVYTEVAAFADWIEKTISEM